MGYSNKQKFSKNWGLFRGKGKERKIPAKSFSDFRIPAPKRNSKHQLKFHIIPQDETKLSKNKQSKSTTNS